MKKRGTPELKILGVHDAGDIKKERLVLEALADIANIDDFMVMDSTFDPQAGKSNLIRHTYRFPAKGKDDEPVKKGDKVAVYTEADNDHTRKNKSSGNTHHFYHMNLKTPIWNQSGDTATVLYCEVVDSKVV